MLRTCSLNWVKLEATVMPEGFIRILENNQQSFPNLSPIRFHKDSADVLFKCRLTTLSTAVLKISQTWKTSQVQGLPSQGIKGKQLKNLLTLVLPLQCTPRSSSPQSCACTYNLSQWESMSHLWRVGKHNTPCKLWCSAGVTRWDIFHLCKLTKKSTCLSSPSPFPSMLIMHPDPLVAATLLATLLPNCFESRAFSFSLLKMDFTPHLAAE